MEMEHKSPWLAVTIGIFGMIAGYTIVLAQTHQLDFSKANHCPSQDISRHTA